MAMADRGDTTAPLPDLQAQTIRKGMRSSSRGDRYRWNLAALILLAPLFLLIAVAIKLTSQGPVLFKQKRVGQYGECSRS